MFRKFTIVLSTLLALTSQVNASPGGLNIGNDTMVCAGSCLTLHSNVSGTYKWSTGDTTASITVCPSSNTTVSLAVTSGTSVYSDSINITVDKYCVWPGDANDNGVVSGRDVLNIGLAYGSTGASRANIGTDWNAQHAGNWSKSFKNGVNYKYADCNGDGKVDSNDLATVHANWSETHSKTEGDTTTVPGNLQLYLVTNSDTFYPNENVNFKIYLGTATNEAMNVYGINFSYQFTPGSVQAGSMSLNVTPSNCWLYGMDGPNAVMSFLQADYNNDIANVAISRTMQPGQNGYGQIGVLGIVTTDNVGSKRNGATPITYGFVEEEAVNGDESDIPLSTKNKTIYMVSKTLGIKAAIQVGDAIDIYPNPVEGNSLNIDLKHINADRISISDLLGNMVYNETGSLSGLNQLHLPDLNTGIYIVQIATHQGIVMRKININH